MSFCLPRLYTYIQTRLDVLRDKATSPPYVVDCAFEVLHKHQYTERRHLLQTLDEVGINADDNDDDDAEDVFVTYVPPSRHLFPFFRRL
jgi:hypothetical protein